MLGSGGPRLIDPDLGTAGHTTPVTRSCFIFEYSEGNVQQLIGGDDGQTAIV
jgi:hypothetical protein